MHRPCISINMTKDFLKTVEDAKTAADTMKEIIQQTRNLAAEETLAPLLEKIHP